MRVRDPNLDSRDNILNRMNLSLDALVTIRGTRDGVLIVLGDGDWDAVLAELTRQLDRPNASAFFRGSQVSVETGSRFLQERERRELQSILLAHNIQLGVTMPAVAPRAPAQPDRSEIYTRENGAYQVMMIRRILRSGQKIHYDGSVVVYGDVNAGAEIVAMGDVLIFGKLRGVVHAGAGGDDFATIGALTLAPPQLRISNFIAASSPEDKKQKLANPEIAVVRDGRIVIEPWQV